MVETTAAVDAGAILLRDGDELVLRAAVGLAGDAAGRRRRPASAKASRDASPRKGARCSASPRSSRRRPGRASALRARAVQRLWGPPRERGCARRRRRHRLTAPRRSSPSRTGGSSRPWWRGRRPGSCSTCFRRRRRRAPPSWRPSSRASPMRCSWATPAASGTPTGPRCRMLGRGRSRTSTGASAAPATNLEVRSADTGRAAPSRPAALRAGPARRDGERRVALRTPGTGDDIVLRTAAAPVRLGRAGHGRGGRGDGRDGQKRAAQERAAAPRGSGAGRGRPRSRPGRRFPRAPEPAEHRWPWPRPFLKDMVPVPEAGQKSIASIMRVARAHEAHDPGPPGPEHDPGRPPGHRSRGRWIRDRWSRKPSRAFEAEAAERGLTLAPRSRTGLPMIRADRDRLFQALANLVGNALKVTTRAASSSALDPAGASARSSFSRARYRSGDPRGPAEPAVRALLARPKHLQRSGPRAGHHTGHRRGPRRRDTIRECAWIRDHVLFRNPDGVTPNVPDP